MTRARSRWRSLLGAWYAVGGIAALQSQVIGSVDVGVSTVRYDEFLPSGAASLSPSIMLQRQRTTLSARGSYLVFESGNRSLQGSVAASTFMPAFGRWRAEFWATTGTSRYDDLASFWHALGGVRMHLVGSRGSLWLDGSAGQASFGDAGRPVIAVATGLLTRLGGATLSVSASRTHVGDTTYTDIGTLARRRLGPFDLEGALAARLWSRGGGRGIFGEASAALELSSRVAVVLAGGRYPTDPIRGSISGRYLTAALRIRPIIPGRLRMPKPSTPPVSPPIFAASGANGSSAPASTLAVSAAGDGRTRFVIEAPDVGSVDIAGDFSDWQPITLTRTGKSRWETILAIPSGVHHINIRLAQGSWFVPAGITRVVDDFGGEIGIFVVP